MKKLNEELEEVLDKHIKNRPIVSEEVVDVVIQYITQFGNTKQALFMCLVALGHAIKHTAAICSKHGDETSFLEVISDPHIKLSLPYAKQLLSCKRFKEE